MTVALVTPKHEFTLEDHQFMARAIALAKKGHYTVSPNPRVGCVLVNQGKIIGEGYHQKAGEGHAEVNAIRDAKQKNPTLIKGATAYVTLEPCSHFGRTPPCAQGLIDVGVSKVISAMVDPNPQVSGNGIAMLAQAGIETQSGLLETAARALNVGFIKKMTTTLPFVRCKLAASLDGKTAMHSGESKWITQGAARKDVQRLRAQSCAIITGCDSIISDNAKMTVRYSELGELQKSYPEDKLRQPLRVVIDSQNRLTPELAFFQQPSPILIIRTELENLRTWPHYVEQVQVTSVKESNTDNNTDNNTTKVDLKALLALLATRGINDVLLESGARLAGAFFEQNLVDELILYQAPKLLGGDGKNLVEMPSITELAKTKQLSINEVVMVGADIRITAKVNSANNTASNTHH
ncbi:bifunctional diaminohydroxyphosphoribosylaminopyrimidine deaminase/5-amino-6-(5-phosphoribosylamino)uracil reductase RibD [Colwellia sp. D2M02]|uniref:bifunctional diaminohydroxyphosphoribosylaminopyrimidine deaminase/5-amino-6-(5-phosphoribosylamino)uracil reductase RibD n=1 Tax=Colwellia sp. D2M02 TaxID=2841562 RepID=UPI00339D396B